MTPRDKNSTEQYQNTTERKRMSLKSRIYLIAGGLTVTFVGGSVITVLVLQRLGLISSNSSIPLSSPSRIPESPVPSTPSTSTNPSASPTISESPISPTPIITNSSSPITSSPGVLYTATKCISDTPGYDISQMLHSPNNAQITIGKEFVSEIANISYGNQLTPQPLEFICNLHSSYKKLNLVFGVNDANPLSQPSNKIQLEIFLDNKSAETRQVTVGAKQTLSLNVEGKNTVGLKVSCTSTCPPLGFLDMGLE
ncbi:MAG: hypothetical protein V7K50_03640 [Nostoc sp.]|uniref:hypothetical protein n=1 Tax=Nostoc sp. TaxID=1180 RepID=UPI002FF4FD02